LTCAEISLTPKKATLRQPCRSPQLFSLGDTKNFPLSTILPETTTIVAGIDPREVVRCRRCRLNQFRTRTNFCRRCDFPLPPTLPLELEISGPESEVQGADSSGILLPGDCNDSSEGHYTRSKTVRNLPIGHRILELRKWKELTQHQMACKAGVPRTYISRIENARLLPGPLMLERIAEALDVAILDILPRNSNGLFPSESDSFWASLSSHFSQLSSRQMLLVLDRVRDMIAEKSHHSFLPAMMAR